jgi:hypothetical protein
VRNVAEARQRRRRWPLLALAGVGLAVALALLGVWLGARSPADPDSGAKKVAVAYTYARLTHDYSTWWDSVAPECRPAGTKGQWITGVRAGYQSLGTPGDPVDTKVRVVSLHTVGDLLRLGVRVTTPVPSRGGDLEVDVQQVDGRWRVVGYGTPGDADRCDVL